MSIYITTSTGRISPQDRVAGPPMDFFKGVRGPILGPPEDRPGYFILNRDDPALLHPKARRALKNLRRFRQHRRAGAKWLRIFQRRSGYKGVRYAVVAYRILP